MKISGGIALDAHEPCRHRPFPLAIPGAIGIDTDNGWERQKADPEMPQSWIAKTPPITGRHGVSPRSELRSRQTKWSPERPQILLRREERRSDRCRGPRLPIKG